MYIWLNRCTILYNKTSWDSINIHIIIYIITYMIYFVLNYKIHKRLIWILYDIYGDMIFYQKYIHVWEYNISCYFVTNISLFMYIIFRDISSPIFIIFCDPYILQWNMTNWSELQTCDLPLKYYLSCSKTWHFIIFPHWCFMTFCHQFLLHFVTHKRNEFALQT